MSFWFNSGSSNVVVNASGQPIDCATCPCDGGGQTCPDICGDIEIPNTLNLVIDGFGTPCAIDGMTATLVWNGSNWSGTGTQGGFTVNFVFSCAGSSGFLLSITGDCLIDNDLLEQPISCDPFEWFTAIITVSADCCDSLLVSATITE